MRNVILLRLIHVSALLFHTGTVSGGSVFFGGANGRVAKIQMTTGTSAPVLEAASSSVGSTIALQRYVLNAIIIQNNFLSSNQFIHIACIRLPAPPTMALSFILGQRNPLRGSSNCVLRAPGLLGLSHSTPGRIMLVSC